MIKYRLKQPAFFQHAQKPSADRIVTGTGLWIWLLCLAVLAGCIPGLGLPTQPAPVSTPNQTVTPFMFPTPTASPAPTRLVVNLQSIVIWLPQSVDPVNSDPAAKLLRARLEEFRRQNPDLKVEVRIKAIGGPGGLLEALSAAAAAAPTVVPSLILLPRPDLEIAASRGVIYSLDGLTSLMSDNDWQDYARQMSIIRTSTYGIPFAGDTQALLYRTSQINAPPTSWEVVLNHGQPVAFTAANTQSLLTLGLYRSAGGILKDTQGRMVLQADMLTQPLKLYAEGSQQGVFPPWLAELETDSQAWQAYQDQKAPWLVTSAHAAMLNNPVDSSLAPLPLLGKEKLAVATGWVWTLSDPSPERRIYSVKLLEFLSDKNFMAEWSAAAKYLPTRSSGLQAIDDQTQRALINQLTDSCSLEPEIDLVHMFGPVIRDAVIQVIKSKTPPEQAAQSAADRLAAPR
jgi:ABC-type glycerol-3-phosphate transport system substrate-binding protein